MSLLFCLLFSCDTAIAQDLSRRQTETPVLLMNGAAQKAAFGSGVTGNTTLRTSSNLFALDDIGGVRAITSSLVGLRSSLDVNVTASALPNGAATEATLSAFRSENNTNISTVQTRLGALNETAPANDTASSGLNGRLQRVAQNLSTIDADLKNGTQKTQLVNSSNANFDMNAGAPSSATLRTVGPITTKTGQYYEFLGTGSSVALPIKIVGNDGLYQAAVDSVGRVATNANVTFPEVTYTKTALRRTTDNSKNMNVNATVGAPALYRYTPVGQVEYVEQFSISIEDQGDFLGTNFGAIAGLTNGLILRVRSKGQLFTLTVLNDNSDNYSVFTEAVGAQSINLLLQSSRNKFWGGWRLQNRIALDPALGDYVEAVVQDNLTGLITLRVYVSVWRTNG